MLDKVYYDHEPIPIHIESHDGYADIWLAKNIHEETSEEGTAWVADEVYGKITENILFICFHETHYSTFSLQVEIEM